MDHIGVIDFRNQGEKSHGGRIIQGKARRQPFSQRGQTDPDRGRKTGCSFTAGPLDPVSGIDPFAVGRKRRLHIRGAMQIRERALSQPLAFLKHIRERQRKVPPRVNFSKCSAEDRRGKDKPLVGVDPARGGKHGGFCPLSGVAQPLKELSVRLTAVIPTQAEEFPKPRDQGGAAVKECKEVHIFVGAGVVPVHQSRLRGG